MWPFFNKPKKNIEPEVYFSEILRIKTNLQNRIWLADENIQKLLGGKRVYESLLASNQYEPGKHGRSIGLFDVLKKESTEILRILRVLHEMLASIQIYVDLEANPTFKNVKNVKDISTSLQGGFKALGERIKKDYTPIVTEVYNYTEKIDVDWNIAFQKYTVMKEAIVGKKGLCYYLERSVERGETTIRKERTRAA